MKQVKFLMKRLLYLIYYGVVFFRIAGFNVFFKQLKHQVFSRSNQVALVLNLKESEFPEIKANIKYTLALATKEDMNEVMEKAKTENKNMVQKLIFRKWMFEDGYRNCYIARTVDTSEICCMAFTIFPTDDDKVEGRFRKWFTRLREEEVILEGAYTFEKFRGNRLHPAIIIDRLKICKEQGYKRVLGYIEESNEASLKGAERVGFKRFGNVPELRFLFFTFRKYYQYKPSEKAETAPASVIDPTTDSRWDDFIAGQENSTIFHTSAWARVIKDTYGYLPQYYLATNDDGQTKAAIPFSFIRCKFTGRRLVCLPFSDYCWPLGGDKADIESLLYLIENKLDTGACTAKYLEIRGWQNELPHARLNLVGYDYYLRYLLDLEPDPDALNARFHHSIRRGIHQAGKRDITVRLTNREEDMERFYHLHLATRRKLGVFPQPHAFFTNLHRHIISQNHGFLGIAEYGGKTVAGVVFLTHGDTIYYKYNASDEKYLKKRPNHLIIWEAIKYACTNKYKHFDFGRCTPEEEGLRSFKARWGAKEMALPYYYYPGKMGVNIVAESSVKYRAMRLFSNVTPRFIFAAVGSALYKHFG